MLKSKFKLQSDEKLEAGEAEELGDTETETVEPEETAAPEEAPLPGRALHKSEVSVRLGHLGKTAEGDGYTYLKAACADMGLNDIKALVCFRHLQFIDVSGNYLTLDNLQVLTDLPYLLLLQADKNQIKSAALKKMKYLQVIIMNYNNIISVEDVFQPELSTLEVGYNQIEKVHFQNRMPQIKCLDFRYNFIQEIHDFDFPNLDSLYLAGNKIKSVVGLEKLVNLRILHLRNNPLKNLDGFDAENKKLAYINLRNTKVSTLRQIKKLRILPALETLSIKGCPLMGGAGDESAEVAQEEEDPEVRVEVLASLPRLKKLNKTALSPEERQEAKDLMAQWLEDGEKDEEEEEVNEEQLEETPDDEDQ